MMSKLLDTCLAPLRSVWANPVVVRDLRAQMRGTKSYWFQGAYLLLLGVLAISGYAQATGQSLSSLHGGLETTSRVSIVEAQDKLEGFYYFIFLTLAALITLIAPALTAGAVIGERQRQSLDLLITTPLSAGELLVGKMLSSIAFLGLLLGLSLPASALCVLLGGATIGDVFRIYALLAIDGVVLAAIGLFFSCASRTGLLALVWTYLTVTAVLFGSWMLYGTCAMENGSISQPAVLTPLLSLIVLNPFIAVLPAGQAVWSVGAFPIPVWIGAAVFSVLIVRLLIAASAYRLGAHGGESGPSLRRQTLLLSGIGMFLIVYSYLLKNNLNGVWQPIGRIISAVDVVFIFLIAFFAIVPFLPGLFVPVAPEDAPPGTAEQSLPANDVPYKLRQAFQPEHAGALPYFHLLTIVLTVAVLLAYRVATGILPIFPRPEAPVSLAGLVLCAAFLMNGLGFCFWAIARFAAGLLQGATQARALAFGIFVLIVAGPALVLSLTSQGYSWNNEPAATLWLLYPLLNANESKGPSYLWMLISGLQSFAWGFAFVLARMRWHKTAAAPAVAA